MTQNPKKAPPKRLIGAQSEKAKIAAKAAKRLLVKEQTLARKK